MHPLSAMSPPRLLLPCLPAVRDSLDIAKLFVAAKMCGVEICEEKDRREGSNPRLVLSEYVCDVTQLDLKPNSPLIVTPIEMANISGLLVLLLDPGIL